MLRVITLDFDYVRSSVFYLFPFDRFGFRVNHQALHFSKRSRIHVLLGRGRSITVRNRRYDETDSFFRHFTIGKIKFGIRSEIDVDVFMSGVSANNGNQIFRSKRNRIEFKQRRLLNFEMSYCGKRLIEIISLGSGSSCRYGYLIFTRSQRAEIICKRCRAQRFCKQFLIFGIENFYGIADVYAFGIPTDFIFGY